MMDAYISTPYQGYRQYHPEEYPEPEGVYTYQTEEEKKLATLEASLSKLEQYLLAPNLSDEDRISCLVSKCQKLKMKIEIEERLSPLPVDIRDYSHMEEEVVEDNTTPMNPLSDEESLVDQMVCEDEEAEQSDEMNVCTEPLPISIIQINKCGGRGFEKEDEKGEATRHRCISHEVGSYDSIFTDAMNQVWGCLATSPVRSQRIYEGRMFRLDHSSYTATETHLFSDQVHVSIYLVFYFYFFRVFGGVNFLCWEWFYVSSRLGISRSWFAGGISRV
ncbi:hypothetical protein HanRHA438_Chr04g0166401 [Helianthus annuus]|nr:hypothetical protein HanRHA438_Chr04g0166401 [Helianthus annuus]